MFAKPLVPGVCKTRLAAGVGHAAAAALAGAFLRDTWEMLAGAGVQPVLATTDPEADFGFPAHPRVDQGDGDLGARLERVLAEAVGRGGGALAVGADSPGMPEDRVRSALAAVAARSACMTPTDDGGFALLAVPHVPLGVFVGLPWSCADTADAVRARLASLGVPCVLTEPWFDIDIPADLAVFRARVPRAAARHTWAALDRLHLGA